ncbi:MAG: hypothetical protein DYG92_04960 [Leptolyngbya sp. PLA1]|nr:hypothetical protein [Leptolyngbya sp. PLA1]
MRTIAMVAAVGLCSSAMGQAQPERVVIPSGPSWGVGAGRANINLLERRTPLIAPTPAAVLPPSSGPSRPVFPCRPVPRPCPVGWERPSTGVVTDGSGLTVDGTYRGEKWGIDFHLGTGQTTRGVSGHCDTGWLPGGYSYPYPIGYTRGAWYATPMQQEQPQVIVLPVPSVGSPTIPETPPPPPTDLERGVGFLREGEVPKAIAALTLHLGAEPEDARAMRLLAAALLLDKRSDDGVAMMRSAYRAEPSLAREPLRAEELGLRDAGLRDLVIRAVMHANRLGSASSWWTVAVLMQAQGKAEQARAMLGKAKAQGIDPELDAAMTSALAP